MSSKKEVSITDAALNPEINNARQAMVGAFDKQAAPIIPMEDDDFIKKYSGPLLLGPFVPAIFALINIFFGQILLSSWTGTCVQALDTFILISIIVCYLFLFSYIWIFVGTDLQFDVPLIGVVKILSTFKDLWSIVFVYVVFVVTSFVVWLIGTLMVQLSALFCVTTSPELYQYALFSVVTFWMGFILGALYIIKELFGSSIGAMVKDTVREINVSDAAESIFKAKYQKYDPRIKVGHIEKKDFPMLLKELGVFIPAEEQNSLMATFDLDDTGFLPYVKMLAWFKELNDSIDDDELDNDSEDSDGPEDKEVAAIEKAEKAKRAAAKLKKQLAGNK